MSTYYSAQLVLGAVVQRAEIFDETKVVPRSCDECEAAHGKGYKFCPECGQAFVQTIRRRWKPQVHRVVQKTNHFTGPEDVGVELFEPPCSRSSMSSSSGCSSPAFGRTPSGR